MGFALLMVLDCMAYAYVLYKRWPRGDWQPQLEWWPLIGIWLFLQYRGR